MIIYIYIYIYIHTHAHAQDSLQNSAAGSLLNFSGQGYGAEYHSSRPFAYYNVLYYTILYYTILYYTRLD